MFSLNLTPELKLFEVIMVVNFSHFDLSFTIMVLFSNILVFTRLNKMGLWNANIVIFYR
jgi:hypothetical protein